VNRNIITIYGKLESGLIDNNVNLVMRVSKENVKALVNIVSKLQTLVGKDVCITIRLKKEYPIVIPAKVYREYIKHHISEM